MLAAASLPGSLAGSLAAQGTRLPMRGANLVETSNAPFGSTAARESLELLAATGANWVAIIPFFWQSGPHDPALVPGDALPPERLRAGIEQAHEAGLNVLVKPHVWVPETWAGAIRMRSEDDWRRWFANYSTALLGVAKVAQESGASALSLGTELRETSARSEWQAIISDVRQVFSGQLTYVAQASGEAGKCSFWPQLDALSVSLYPELGAPGDRAAWGSAMARELAQLQQLAGRYGKPLWLGEVGVRSAQDASYRPWESAEERHAGVDLALQAQILSEWLLQAQRHDADALFVWRWFTDPRGGGVSDTDFTIQNKPAEEVLRQAWS